MPPRVRWTEFSILRRMGAAATIVRRLDWGDTDAAGFWHHSTFWKFAEAAEAEMARQLGLSDLMFGHSPRRTVSAEFHRPIYFDDEVTIGFSVERVGTTSATFRVEMSTGGDLAAEGTIVAVLIDDDARPRPWPADAAALLAAG